MSVQPFLPDGNKRCKLHDNLKQIRANGHHGVLGFGGAWSNLICNLASAAPHYGLASVGIIRGLHHHQSNAMLDDAAGCGMQLRFVSHSDYRQRHNEAWQAQLLDDYPGYAMLPEGGSNLVAVKACKELLDADGGVHRNVSHWAVAVGTGATLAGMTASLPEHGFIEGFQVVKDPSVDKRVTSWLQQLGCNSDYLLVDAIKPGYARLDAALCETVDRVFAATGVLLDPVYSAKVVHSLQQRIAGGYYPAGSTLAVVHTGGRQAWRGVPEAALAQLSAEVRSCIASHSGRTVIPDRRAE